MPAPNPREPLQTANEAALLRTLFDEATDGLFVTSPQMRLALVNDRGCEISGYTLMELRALSIADLLDPDELRASPLEILSGTSGETYRRERLLVRKDGTRVPCEISARRLVDGRILGVVRDLSTRKRDERSIAALARLYALLSGVNQSIVRATDEHELLQSICDVAVGIGGFRMAWAGLAVAETGIVAPVARAGHEEGYLDYKFSTTPQAATGQGPTGAALRAGVIVTTDDIATDPRMEPWRRAALARGYRSSAAVPFRHPTRGVGTLNLYSGEPGFFTGDERGILDEISRAITFALEARGSAAERLRLQEHLTQAQKMDSIGRLAGGVAHDFNNMLSVIMGHAELALTGLDPTDAVRQDIVEIQRAAARSADLTRQLLAFARRQPIAPRLLDLNTSIEGSLRMLRRLIGEDVALQWRPDSHPWPVRVDPSQVDQLLTNLVVNSRDAIAGVGEIRIATGKVTLPDPTMVIPATGANGEFAMIEVADTGSGMDEETQSHAFEPFFTTKEEGKGTGLGLATVYGIVRQNGGFIWLTSAIGRGTTVRILLPRVHPTAAELAVSREEEDLTRLPGGTERILLVEDERAVRELARQVLERLGYAVVAAATPKEALDLAGRGDAPALALLDVVMPEMNGVDLSRRLMTLVPAMRYLFFSAYPADVVTNRGLIPETAPFLAKPFTARELARKVRDVLDGA